MPHADIHGQRIFYSDSGGDGPAVVMAHGFLMDHTMFAAQAEALAPEFRAIAWDARGFGKTEYDGEPFTYWDSAADCLALLDHLGIDRAVLVGMSQGGYMALRAALLSPERVRALVLIDTAAHTDTPEEVAGYRQLFTTWQQLGPIDMLIENVAAMLMGGREHWEPWVSRWRERTRDSLDIPSQCLLGRDDITSRLGEIQCPALIFHGSEDRAIPLARAELMRDRLPDCRGLHVVPGAAHAPNLTHPDAVNPPLLAFLRSLPPSW